MIGNTGQDLLSMINTNRCVCFLDVSPCLWEEELVGDWGVDEIIYGMIVSERAASNAGIGLGTLLRINDRTAIGKRQLCAVLYGVEMLKMINLWNNLWRLNIDSLPYRWKWPFDSWSRSVSWCTKEAFQIEYPNPSNCCAKRRTHLLNSTFLRQISYSFKIQNKVAFNGKNLKTLCFAQRKTSAGRSFRSAGILYTTRF